MNMDSSCDLEAALGAVMPDKADVGRINACSNEDIQILVNDVFQLYKPQVTTKVKSKK